MSPKLSSMNNFVFYTDPKVIETVEEAVSKMCDVLDDMFPGHDNGGINSDFQGTMVDVVLGALKGNLYNSHGYYVTLPKLVQDESFFGDHTAKATGYLIASYKQYKPITVLSPDHSVLVPIKEATDAWTSFDAALKVLLDIIKNNGYTMLDLNDYKFRIVPVSYDSEYLIYKIENA